MKNLFLASLVLGLTLSAFPQLPEDTNFLVHVNKMMVPAEGDAVRMCYTVFPDGEFRIDRVSQAWGDVKNADFKVYKGKLAPEQLPSLQAILNDPSLVDHPETRAPHGLNFREGEWLYVYIPRSKEKKVQEFQTVNAFGVYDLKNIDAQRNGNGAGSSTMDQKYLQPLLKWIKENVEKKKGSSIKGLPSRCAPPGGFDSLKKPPVSS